MSGWSVAVLAVVTVFNALLYLLSLRNARRSRDYAISARLAAETTDRLASDTRIALNAVRVDQFVKPASALKRFPTIPPTTQPMRGLYEPPE